MGMESDNVYTVTFTNVGSGNTEMTGFRSSVSKRCVRVPGLGPIPVICPWCLVCDHGEVDGSMGVPSRPRFSPGDSVLKRYLLSLVLLKSSEVVVFRVVESDDYVCEYQNR